jgi:hypothetical protein
MSAFLGQLVWSDSALFLWKTLATIATAAFGVYGLGVNARDDAGRLTKQGTVVLGGLIVSALITGVIQTGEFVEKRQEAADQLVQSQEVLMGVERNVYPLQPLSMWFELEYSMKDPALSSYAVRLQKAIADNFRSHGKAALLNNDGVPTENGWKLNMDSFPKDFGPGTNAGDGNAAKILEQDDTGFLFVNPKPGPTIEFLSCDPNVADAIEKFPSEQKISQTITGWPSYKRRVFVKHVVVKNAVRLGDDTFARGAVDLVGRIMTWRSHSDVPSGQLTKFSLRFPFDYDIDSQFFTRMTSVSQGPSQIFITGEMVGLQPM